MATRHTSSPFRPDVTPLRPAPERCAALIELALAATTRALAHAPPQPTRSVLRVARRELVHATTLLPTAISRQA